MPPNTQMMPSPGGMPPAPPTRPPMATPPGPQSGEGDPHAIVQQILQKRPEPRESYAFASLKALADGINAFADAGFTELIAKKSGAEIPKVQAPSGKGKFNGPIPDDLFVIAMLMLMSIESAGPEFRANYDVNLPDLAEDIGVKMLGAILKTASRDKALLKAMSGPEDEEEPPEETKAEETNPEMEKAEGVSPPPERSAREYM